MMHRITPRIQEICDAGGTSAKERSQKPPKVQFCPMPIYNPSSNPNSMLGHPFKLPGATYITPPHRAPIYAGVKPQNFAQALKDQKSTLLSARLGIANFSSVKASHPSLQSRKKPKMPPVDPKEETPCRKRKRAPKRPKISRKSSERQIRFSTYTPPVAKPQESITAPRNSGMSRASSPVHPLLDLLSNPIRNDLYHPARPPLSWYPRNPNASATTPSSTPHAKAGVGTTLQHSTSPLVQDHLPSSKFPVFANPSTWDAKRVAHENALRQRMTENTARYEGIKKDGSTSQNLPPPAIQTRPPPLMTKNQHLPSIVVKNYAKPVVATLPKPNIVFSGHEPSSSLPVPTKIKEVAPLPDLPSFPFLQEDSDMPDLSYLHSFSSCTDASLLKQDAPVCGVLKGGVILLPILKVQRGIVNYDY